MIFDVDTLVWLLYSIFPIMKHFDILMILQKPKHEDTDVDFSVMPSFGDESYTRQNMLEDFRRSLFQMIQSYIQIKMIRIDSDITVSKRNSDT